MSYIFEQEDGLSFLPETKKFTCQKSWGLDIFHKCDIRLIFIKLHFMLKGTAIGVVAPISVREVWGLISEPVKSNKVSPRFDSAATFLRSSMLYCCVVKPLSPEMGSVRRYSLRRNTTIIMKI